MPRGRSSLLETFSTVLLCLCYVVLCCVAIVRERVSSIKVLWSNVWKDESLPRLDSSEFRVKFDGLLYHTKTGRKSDENR